MTPEVASALIERIVTRYHALRRQEITELIRQARLVEATHAHHPQLPRKLADLLMPMPWETEALMQNEENGLFPMLRDDQGGMVMAMELMGDDHAARVEQITTLTRGHQLPEDACGAWRALYVGTAKFAADLCEHIRVENKVLFPSLGG